ncbi:hypothetical protein P0136_01570 [Lentisphaerota bacterium ZTH]|nr:hypothetical protein JYG24_07290 [Lentisphaerota bacterium]WET06703.1 hypothetical protein P0136_01570 [Lentisphaerota bacterium ZTH]
MAPTVSIKKKPLPVVRTPDYEFLAAKIMHVFGGYTVSALLAEPASTFFILIKMADRAAADTALDTIAAGVGAAIGNSSRGLEQRRGSFFKRHTDPAALQKFEQNSQYYKELAAEYMGNRHKNSITETIKLDDFKKTIET